MKVSIVPGSLYYIEDPYNYRVYLDGEEQKHCIEASEEEGYILCYDTDQYGELTVVLDSNTYISRTIKLYGEVKVVYNG